jgi:hypothetical protein
MSNLTENLPAPILPVARAAGTRISGACSLRRRYTAVNSVKDFLFLALLSAFLALVNRFEFHIQYYNKKLDIQIMQRNISVYLQAPRES